jgi:predicted acylesterase/phospholipase RssA
MQSNIYHAKVEDWGVIVNMSAPSIQLAFQGGGAKLIDMLPIAHAFLHCHNNRTIRISAVSGTSAGAICAALIATGCNFNDLRRFLSESGHTHITRIIPSQVRSFERFATAGMLQRITILLGNASYIKRVVFDGEAVLNEKEFSAFVSKLLSFGDRRIKMIEDTSEGIPLLINTSNVERSENHVFEKGSLVEAVVDSCSIPFAFRSFSKLSATPFVDGGLCENLPIDCLLTRDSKDPVFAVFPSVENGTDPVANALAYLMRLFAASINHGVKRSKALVSPAFSISIESDLSTFSFAEALARISNTDWYENRFAAQIHRIEDFAASYGPTKPDSFFRFIDVDDTTDYIESLVELTADYHTKCEYKVGRYEIIVNCDKPLLAEEDYRPGDTVITSATIKVTDESFRYFRSSVQTDPKTKQALPTIWSAYNRTRHAAIPIKVLSLRRRAGRLPTSMACIIMFTHPEQHLAVGDEIEIQSFTSIKDGMRDLNRSKPDFFGLENPHPLPVSSAELILTYPT